MAENHLSIDDPRRSDRVRDRTPEHVLARIDHATAERILKVGREGPSAILRRIEQLDREWDLDRWLALNFTVATTYADLRGWTLLRRIQQLFLGSHALFGWSPPAAILRRLGVRTSKEIATERAVLVDLYRLSNEEIAVTEVEVVYEPATDTSVGTPLR